MLCCEFFEDLIFRAGQTGLSVLVTKSSVGIGFVLQSRGLSIDEVHACILNAPYVTNVNIECEIGIKYCPFCGKDLRDLTARFPEFYDLLCQQQKKLLRIKEETS
jgi:hypothetical protein